MASLVVSRRRALSRFKLSGIVRRAGFEPRDLQVALVFFHPFGLSELPPQGRIGRDLNTATSQLSCDSQALYH